MKISYPGIAKMALEAQKFKTEEEAYAYMSSMMAASRFMNTSGLEVTKRFKPNIHERVILEIKNPLEIREVREEGKDIYVRILCDKQ